MKINFIKINDKYIYIFLVLFSFYFNRYYGNLGVFPIDTFAFFDSAYNILIGRHPFKDIWVTTGPVVDYFQAFFFKVFGLNWNSYVIHASITNSLIVIFFYKTLTKFALGKKYSFFYSVLFSMLAYTVSGTPFAYVHSYILSLFSVLIFFHCIKFKSKIAFFFLPVILFFSFFSMQNPSTFFIIIIFILLLYFFLNFRFSGFLYLIYGSVFTITLFAVYLVFSKVSIIDIWRQYFLFPLSIGENRIEGNEMAHISLAGRATFRNIFGHFKFINFYILGFFIITIFCYFKKKIRKEDLIINITLILSGIFLIFNQLITSNQTFIFSFILFIGSFFHLFLKKYFFISKKFEYFIIFLVLFSTVKYHLEYNQKRKFMDLQNVDLKQYSTGIKLDKKLKNLKWITPEFSQSSQEEIDLLFETKNILKKDTNSKMVITHYQFFSLLLEENLNIPNRWYTHDNNSYPLNNNKLFSFYKNHINKILEMKNINNIYVIGNDINFSNFFIFFNDLCFSEEKKNKIVKLYKVINCN